jgi:hypothetical protein
LRPNDEIPKTIQAIVHPPLMNNCFLFKIRYLLRRFFQISKQFNRVDCKIIFCDIFEAVSWTLFPWGMFFPFPIGTRFDEF